LNTIISRCQVVRFGPLKDEEIKSGLLKTGMEDQGKATLAAQLANGDFNAALNYIQQKENNFADLFLDWFRKCFVGNGPTLVKFVAELSDLGRENQKQFISYGLFFLRELLLIKSNPQGPFRLTGNTLESAVKLKELISFEQLEAIAELLNKLHYHVERNAYPKVLFLDASLKVNKILKNKIPARPGERQG